MDNKILAETSILIDLQKGVQKTINVFDKYLDQITISRITACEFIYGSKNANEKKLNKDFIDKLAITEINEEISKYAYFLLDKYALATKFGIADTLIASTAVIEDFHLWTLNTRHFERIKELKLFKP